MAAYQVSPLKQFNFSRPEEWPKWACRFEKFRCASGLLSNGEEIQVHIFIYSMENATDDILKSFGLLTEE